jgi:hypothetical protein
MKLELKHLAPYLPYGLKVSKDDWGKTFKMDSDGTTLNCVGIDFVIFKQAKPILRPLSDLTKEIEHNGKKFIPIIAIAKMDTECSDIEFEINEFGNCLGRLNSGVIIVFEIVDEIPFIKEIHNNILGQFSGNDWDDMHLSSILPSEIREKLLEFNFDVFNLIPAGLAIDINTIEK